MKETSLILIKHDGILRGLIGEIIKRFENISLKIIAMKMIMADEELAENHYQITEEWANSLGNRTRKTLEEKGIEVKESNIEIATKVQSLNKEYLQEGPIIAIVLEGNHAVDIVRKIIGHTEARQSLPGTIRGDFGYDSYEIANKEKRSVRNLIHASGSTEEANREIALWFNKKELHSYSNSKDKGVY